MSTDNQPADRMPSSVNQKQADLVKGGATFESTQQMAEEIRQEHQAATAATKEATQATPSKADYTCEAAVLDSVRYGNVGSAAYIIAAHVARATERLREDASTRWDKQYGLTCAYIATLCEAHDLASESVAVLQADLANVESGPEQSRVEAEKTRLNQAIQKLSAVRGRLTYKEVGMQESALATLREERDELRKALEATLDVGEIKFGTNALARVVGAKVRSALTRHEGREGQQKSDPVGTQASLRNPTQGQP